MFFPFSSIFPSHPPLPQDTKWISEVMKIFLIKSLPFKSQVYLSNFLHWLQDCCSMFKPNSTKSQIMIHIYQNFLSNFKRVASVLFTNCDSKFPSHRPISYLKIMNGFFKPHYLSFREIIIFLFALGKNSWILFCVACFDWTFDFIFSYVSSVWQTKAYWTWNLYGEFVKKFY